jgi:uncharacterized protein (TIGR02099 family)
MIRILRSFAAKVWLVLILLIILSAVGIGVMRLLLPMAEGYRAEVQEKASELLGQPVRIADLSARWRGFGPEVVLKDVQLMDREDTRPLLHLTEVHVGIGVIDTLRTGTISPREIAFYGARLLIKHRSDGAVLITGLEGLSQNGEAGGALLFLPFRLALRESELYWENQAIGAEPIHFTGVSIELTNDGDRHQLDATFALPGQGGKKMQLAADIRGELQSPGGWSGDFYLNGDQLSISQLLSGRVPEGYNIERGSTDMKLWSHWKEGRLTGMQGDVQWHQFKLTGPADEETPQKILEMKELGGKFQWQRKPDGWRLDIADIKLERGGRLWPSSNLSLAGRYDPEGRIHLRAGIDFLRIEDLLAVVEMFPLPAEELNQILATLQPQADFHSLQIEFDETADAPRWRGRGRVEKLNTQPWRDAPGVKNLAAEFHLNQDGGELTLQSQNVTATFPKLFRDPLQLDQAGGRLQWERIPKEDGWRLQSNELLASNQDIKTRTRLLMEIFSSPDHPDFLDLQTDFRDGNVSTTSHYLPVGIMSDEVVAWLDRSLVSGKLINGSCVFRGPLRDFPFEQHSSGRFEVLFGVEDLTLDYWPQWPRSEEIEAEIRFLNNRFDAWIESGKLLESTLQNLHGRIEHLSKASPFLLTGKVAGPLHDELRLLGETPLSDRFAPLVEAVSAEGEAKLELDLAIPLREGKVRLNGSLSLASASLQVQGWQLPITDLAGELRFDEDGIHAKQLAGRLLEEKVTADVNPAPGGSGITRVTANATLSSAKLAKHFPNLGIGELQGSTTWNVQLDIPPLRAQGKTEPVAVQLSSNLKGIQIDQPAPLGKSAEEARKLTVQTRLGGSGNEPLRVRYGDVLEALVQSENTGTPQARLTRGNLRFGGAAAKLPKEPALWVDGRLAKLHIDPWLKLIKSGDTSAFPRIVLQGLQIGRLRYGDTVLEEVTLDAKGENNGWDGHIDSKTVAGTVHIPLPLKHGPVVLRLDRLNLAIDPDNLADIPQSEAAAWTDPRTLPGIDLQSKQLLLNGSAYGPLEMVTSHIPDGLTLEKISVKSDHLDFAGHGEWIVFNGRSQTAIDFQMETESLGKLLKHLGFAPNLQGAPAEVEASLRWSGNPRQFSSTDLNGRLKMELKKGRFLEVEPGLGRVFGLLNLGALQRRLTLDFSDLFKKGFSFDLIEGSFLLDEGDAYTNNLRIEGPAADIDISGRIGLVEHDFDQHATVTPKLTASLPVAGAIAGGPAVGAAIYLAQKIFGKRVDKASSTQYLITGSWENPNVTKQSQALEGRLSGMFENETEPDEVEIPAHEEPPAPDEQ